LFSITLFITQAQVHRCAFDEVNQWNASQNPDYLNVYQSTFQQALNNTQSHSFKDSRSVVYRIPVVVHVVYNNAQQNIDDSLIFNQIEVLNRDFGRKNADTSSIRNIFSSIGIDGSIEFYLACTDPNGLPTNGITRTETNKTAFSLNPFGTGGIDDVKFDSIGGKSSWDTDKYLNLWVCNLNDPGSLFGVVLGFAYPPLGAPNWPSNAAPT